MKNYNKTYFYFINNYYAFRARMNVKLIDIKVINFIIRIGTLKEL